MEEKILAVLYRIAVALERMAEATAVDPVVVELAKLQSEHLKAHLGKEEEPKKQDG